MLVFIIRRMLFLGFVLFGVSVLIFSILMTFSPERRAATYISTPQQAKDLPLIIKEYGLDKPFYVQYYNWLKEITKGNFGYSLVASQSVWSAFWQYFPITMELNLYAMPLIILIGIWLGVLSGINRGKWIDHITRIFAIIGWSLPTFLFALIVLMLFYGYVPLFPPGEISDKFSLVINNPELFTRYTRMYTLDGLLNGRLDIVFDALRHLVLPVLTQVVVIIAILVRVMRSGMIEEISKDYMITAKAKGANNKTLYYKHAKKNALIPVITIAGELIAYSIQGSIAVEVVFNRQGIGSWLASSATQLDVPVILAMSLFIGIVFVISNLIIDILYAYIDPRIRLG